LVVAFFFTCFSINIMTGIIPVIIVTGCAACLALYHKELYYFITKRQLVVFYPLLVLLSASWSLVPSTSLWYGIQLAVTILACIFMGITATPRQFVRGVYIAMIIVFVASVIWGRTGASAVGNVLIGVTGTKNALGFAGVTLVGTGLAILTDRQQPTVYRYSTLLLIPVGAYFATHVESASSLISVIVFPIAFFGFLALRYLTVAGRWALVATLLVLFVPISSIGYSEYSTGLEGDVLRALNKDPTLTGRTVMWAKADYWISQSPIVGYGYRAFWMSSSADSIGILHKFNLTDPRGFQLHNTIKEILVDTGWLGLTIVLSTVVVFLFYVISLVFLNPAPSSAFIAATFLLMIVRAQIESVLLSFYPGTALLYVCGIVAMVSFMNRSAPINAPAKPGLRRFTNSRPDRAQE